MPTGLRQTGVRLVADNETGFLRAMDNANRAVDRFGARARGTSGGLSILDGVVVGLGAGLVNLAGNAINRVVDGLGQVAAGAVGAVGELQNLTITLETLAAREIVAAGGAENVTEALDQAGPAAQYLLKQLRDLSIESPFEYKDIVGIFNLNMAFGQGIELSLDLTKAISDIAAVNRNVPGVLERITYNFSQMSLVGKITMRDVRDLALAGVDLARVLREELGKSIQEVNADLESGKLTMADVSAAFVHYAEENFGDAAKRASRSLSGLVSSFKDLAFFASADLFKPALDRVTEFLGGILDRARVIVDSGILQDVGAIFDVMAEQMLGSSQRMPAIADGMLGDLRARFQNFALEAAQYGANIVESLAVGFIEGASAVIDALAYIGSIIAYWLSPGSPPKLLPELPQWGMAYMAEILRGMSQADFGALKAVQGPLQSALGILTQTGQMDKGAAGKLFANLSRDLAKALTSGVADEGLFEKIARSAGPFGAEIAELARRQFELAQATEAVKAAEERLDAARSKTKKLVAQYNAALRAGASSESLKGMLAQVDAAQAEAQAAQEAKDAAGENIDTLKERASLQEEIVRQLLDISKAQIVPPEAGEGGAAAAGALGGLIPKLPPLAETLDESLAGFREKITGIFNTMRQNILDAWNQSSLKTVWENLVQLFTGDGATLEERISTFLQGVFKMDPEKADDLAGSLADLYTSVYDLATLIDWPKLIGWVAGFTVALVGLLEILMLLDLPLVGFVGNLMWANDTIGMLEKSPAFTSLVEKFKRGMDEIAVKAGEIFTSIPAKLVETSITWGLVWEGMRELLRRIWDEMVGKVVAAVGSLVEPIKGTLTEELDKFRVNILEPLAAGFNAVREAIEGVVTWVGKLIEAVLSGDWATVWRLLDPILPGSLPPMAAGLEQVSKSIRKFSQVELPRLSDQLASVPMVARPGQVAGGATSNVYITVPVTATVGSGADVNVLAYQVAREIAVQVRG